MLTPELHLQGIQQQVHLQNMQQQLQLQSMQQQMHLQSLQQQQLHMSALQQQHQPPIPLAPTQNYSPPAPVPLAATGPPASALHTATGVSAPPVLYTPQAQSSASLNPLYPPQQPVPPIPLHRHVVTKKTARSRNKKDYRREAADPEGEFEVHAYPDGHVLLSQRGERSRRAFHEDLLDNNADSRGREEYHHRRTSRKPLSPHRPPVDMMPYRQVRGRGRRTRRPGRRGRYSDEEEEEEEAEEETRGYDSGDALEDEWEDYADGEDDEEDEVTVVISGRGKVTNLSAGGPRRQRRIPNNVRRRRHGPLRQDVSSRRDLSPVQPLASPPGPCYHHLPQHHHHHHPQHSLPTENPPTVPFAPPSLPPGFILGAPQPLPTTPQDVLTSDGVREAVQHLTDGLTEEFKRFCQTVQEVESAIGGASIAYPSPQSARQNSNSASLGGGPRRQQRSSTLNNVFSPVQPPQKSFSPARPTNINTHMTSNNNNTSLNYNNMNNATSNNLFGVDPSQGFLEAVAGMGNEHSTSSSESYVPRPYFPPQHELELRSPQPSSCFNPLGGQFSAASPHQFHPSQISDAHTFRQFPTIRSDVNFSAGRPIMAQDEPVSISPRAASSVSSSSSSSTSSSSNSNTSSQSESSDQERSASNVSSSSGSPRRRKSRHQSRRSDTSHPSGSAKDIADSNVKGEEAVLRAQVESAIQQLALEQQRLMSLRKDNQMPDLLNAIVSLRNDMMNNQTATMMMIQMKKNQKVVKKKQVRKPKLVVRSHRHTSPIDIPPPSAPLVDSPHSEQEASSSSSMSIVAPSIRVMQNRSCALSRQQGSITADIKYAALHTEEEALKGAEQISAHVSRVNSVPIRRRSSEGPSVLTMRPSHTFSIQAEEEGLPEVLTPQVSFEGDLEQKTPPLRQKVSAATSTSFKFDDSPRVEAELPPPLPQEYHVVFRSPFDEMFHLMRTNPGTHPPLTFLSGFPPGTAMGELPVMKSQRSVHISSNGKNANNDGAETSSSTQSITSSSSGAHTSESSARVEPILSVVSTPCSCLGELEHPYTKMYPRLAHRHTLAAKSTENEKRKESHKVGENKNNTSRKDEKEKRHESHDKNEKKRKTSHHHGKHEKKNRKNSSTSHHGSPKKKHHVITSNQEDCHQRTVPQDSAKSGSVTTHSSASSSSSCTASTSSSSASTSHRGHHRNASRSQPGTGALPTGEVCFAPASILGTSAPWGVLPPLLGPLGANSLLPLDPLIAADMMALIAGDVCGMDPVTLLPSLPPLAPAPPPGALFSGMTPGLGLDPLMAMAASGGLGYVTTPPASLGTLPPLFTPMPPVSPKNAPISSS